MNSFIRRVLKSKLWLWVFLSLALIEGFWILLSQDLTKSISMTSYFFYDADSDDYVSAEGSWLSTTQLAFPIQTIKMDCWKDNMSCIVATTTLVEGTGSLDLNHLDLDIDYEGIATWSKEEIKTVPRSTVTGCVEYATVIDRKSETVTSTRRTISAEGDCSVIQEESVVLTLGDGYERINLWRQGK